MAMADLLTLSNISKSYRDGAKEEKVLNNVNFSLSRGEICALIGVSGSGKTSLLHIAGLLDNPTSGEVYIAGKDVTCATDREKSRIRGEMIGFVYQFHHLLPDFTIVENLLMYRRDAKDDAMHLLESLDIADKAHQYPSTLSGGEAQRVAIARSLIHKPSLILADEPTGNLNKEMAVTIFNLLHNEVKSRNIAMLLVTHDQEMAKKADKVFTMSDGALK